MVKTFQAKCHTNTHDEGKKRAWIYGSVRGNRLSFVTGGHPHLTFEQAIRLADWLEDAIEELMRRDN